MEWGHVNFLCWRKIFQPHSNVPHIECVFLLSFTEGKLSDVFIGYFLTFWDLSDNLRWRWLCIVCLDLMSSRYWAVEWIGCLAHDARKMLKQVVGFTCEFEVEYIPYPCVIRKVFFWEAQAALVGPWARTSWQPTCLWFHKVRSLFLVLDPRLN